MFNIEAFKDFINCLGNVTSDNDMKKKIVEKKSFTNNSVLNDVLNETANGDWKTLGGGEFTTDRMQELVGRQYGNMMNEKIAR
mgnify:CR=1 FL=1